MDKEYIDREAARKAVYQYLLEQTVSKYATAEQCNAARGGVSGAMEVLDDVPAADVAPVVHSEWEYYTHTMMACSICKRHVPRHKFEYCPHCGAKMKEEHNA